MRRKGACRCLVALPPPEQPAQSADSQLRRQGQQQQCLQTQWQHRRALRPVDS